jgi:SAM-dependent methyltransferase
MDRRWYPAFGNNWDDEILRRRVLARLQPGMSALDLGAGAGIVAQMDFRSSGARICGLDPDVRVRLNPHLHEARVASAEAIPWPAGAFDVVFADNVLEHLREPARVFQEVFRVLKPGGRFLAKTPNKWHYMPIVARLTPHGFHGYINKIRGRDTADTFPTRYRANSRRALLRLAAGAGLAVERLDHIEGRPEYLRMSPLTYPIGYAYERIVNSTKLLQGLRVVLLAEFCKPPLEGRDRVIAG